MCGKSTELDIIVWIIARLCLLLSWILAKPSVPLINLHSLLDKPFPIQMC